MNSNRLLISSFALTALALAVAACSETTEPSGPSPSNTECTDATKAGCVVASAKQRQTPSAPEADVKDLVKGNTAFALGVYQQLRGEPGNLFYSPFSISEALAMTWAGARNNTETVMANALHFTLPQDQLHPAFNALDTALMSRGKNAKASDGKGFRLNIANALWGQLGFSFGEPFLDTLAMNYGAGMHVVDFEASPEPSRELINQWVADRTEDKIKDLLPKGSVSPDTRLVLTNAIYFNAAWLNPFEVASTTDGDFKREDGTKVTVPFMKGSQEVGYASGDGWAAVELPYDGNELSMVAVLPEAGTLDAFEAALDDAKLAAILGAMNNNYQVDMTVPKFKIESSFGLKKALSALGMEEAFTDKADFTGIYDKGGLSISDVVHKAFVKVDEAGTEAAAATGVIVGVTSAPPPAEIHLDHPFVLFIRDNATGSILFMGRVSDPS
ncbi:MAG: serpin family protein [Byssovorax sp.]